MIVIRLQLNMVHIYAPKLIHNVSVEHTFFVVYPTSRMLAWEDGWGCSLRSNGQTDVYGVSYQKIWEIYGNVRDFHRDVRKKIFGKGKHGPIKWPDSWELGAGMKIRVE